MKPGTLTFKRAEQPSPEMDSLLLCYKGAKETNASDFSDIASQARACHSDEPFRQRHTKV